jgi:hypothetical protein
MPLYLLSSQTHIDRESEASSSVIRNTERRKLVLDLLASFDSLVATRVLGNPADTKEVRSGVANRNLSITETSFIKWVFPHAGGIRCPSYPYSELAPVRC